MNIVITGATSFIGIGIINKLLEKDNNKIWAVIRPNSINKTRIPQKEQIKIIELDMMRIEKLNTYISEPIDIFYHLAWEGVRAPKRDDKQLQESNYLAALKAFRVSVKLKSHKFIGCGSQAEYGSMSGRITEEYPCNPNTEYGKAKNKACKEIEILAKEQKMDFIWGRIFSIYGLGDYKGSLVMTCLDKMSKGEPVALTECIQEWDYLYIDEVSEIFAKFAVCDCKSGVYNVASGNHKKLKDYVEIMKSVTKSNSLLEYGKVPYPAQGMVSFIPDVSKLKKEINWNSTVTFEDGINHIIQGWRK